MLLTTPLTRGVVLPIRSSISSELPPESQRPCGSGISQSSRLRVSPNRICSSSCQFRHNILRLLAPSLAKTRTAGASGARGSVRFGVEAAASSTTQGANPGATGANDSSVQSLEQWLGSHGFPLEKVMLKERPSKILNKKPIHYIAASKDLKPGDVAFQVPDNLVVTLERVLGDESIAELLTTNKLSELACLALYLMYEKKRGRHSFWFPFIHELDRQRGRGQLAVESPLLWTEEEIEDYLAGSPIKELIAQRILGIEREYEELDTVWFMAGSLFKQYPFDIPTEAFSLKIFKEAFVAVQACVVHLQGVSLAKRFALVPLGPPLLAYKSNCRCMLKSEGGLIHLTLDQAVKKGDPISVWCGPQPNDRLLLNYGFVDEDNPYDRLSVQAALCVSDPLYQIKRQIVQKNSLLTKNVFQVYKGREKEAVVEMMPYLRLGHVSDPLELDSVTFAQGPVCGVGACNERAVLAQMESHFQSRLANYPTTIQQDDAVIADPASNSKHVVASKLVRIEKQIIENTLAAIREISSELPQEEDDVSPCEGPYQPTLQ